MVFSFFGEKAQSTAEYLVLVGLLVTVSLLVAGLVINQVDSSSSTFSKADNLGAVAGAFATDDFTANSSGELYLTIANHSDESITLSSVTIDGVTASYSDDIDFDSSKSFKLLGVAECVGVSGVYAVSFSYISESGLTKTYSFGTLRVPCSNEAALIETSEPVVVPEGESLYSAFFYLDSNFSGGSFGLTNLVGSNSGVAYDGNSKIVQPENIVGLWHLNDNADDSSSNANNGSLVGGAFYTNGFWGTSALDTNGTQGYVAIPSNSASDLQGDFSIFAWVNYASLDVGSWWQDSFVCKDDATNKWMLTYANGYGTLLWHVQPSNVELHSSVVNMPLNEWHQLGLTRSGNDYTFYYDGAAAGTASSSVSIPTQATDLWIGKCEGYADVKVEDLTIWDAALSATDVTTLYDSWGVDSNYISPVYDTGTDSNFVSLKYNFSGSGVTTYSYGDVLLPSKETDLAVSLNGLWHLNVTLSNPVNDSSSYSIDGELGGSAGPVAALWDRDGLQLDGSSAYVKIPVVSPSHLEPDSAVSLSIWAKRVSTNFDGELIFAKPLQNPNFWAADFYNYSHTAPDYSYGFITTTQAGALSFVIKTEGAGNPTQTANATLPSDGLWHHLAGTYDGSAVKIYVDGVLVDSESATGDIYYPNTDVAVGIGGAPFGNEDYFHGTLQEAAIWGRALSETEIQEVFSKGASKLGIKYRGCDNADCSDGSWSALDSNINTSIDVTSILDKRYFQYQVLPSLYTFEGSQQFPNAYPKFADLNFVYMN